MHMNVRVEHIGTGRDEKGDGRKYKDLRECFSSIMMLVLSFRPSLLISRENIS